MPRSSRPAALQQLPTDCPGALEAATKVRSQCVGCSSWQHPEEVLGGARGDSSLLLGAFGPRIFCLPDLMS
ncbi:hypothetical protein LEMLEM_LOCUS13983 [Lemmus lemmus]